MLIITFLGCFFFKLYLFVYGVCVCMHTHVQTCDHTWVSWHLCGGQRTTRGVVSLHPHWVPAIGLRSSGLMVSTFAAKFLTNPSFPSIRMCLYVFMHAYIFFFVFEFRVFVHVKHMLCLLATPSLLGYVFCFSLTFCSMWGWTQGLMNASQMFYHCAISSALFCFCFFTFYFETGLRLVLNPSCSSGRP